jgi:hypothetical protein
VQHAEARKILASHAKVLNRTPRTPDPASASANREASERVLDMFGALVGTVTMLATQVDASASLKAIDTTRVTVPRNTTRALVRDGLCWLAVPRDIGLARDMPCRLLLFIDGLAVCVLNPAIGGSSKVWTLHEWISGDELVEVVAVSPTVAVPSSSASPAPLLPAPTFGLATVKTPKIFHTFVFHSQDEAQQWADSLLEPMAPLTGRLGPAQVAAQVRSRRLSAPTAFLQSVSGRRTTPIFGGVLGTLIAELAIDQPGLKVPSFVHRIGVNIVKRGLREEGLFRVSAETSLITDLRQKIIKQDSEVAHRISKGLPATGIPPIKYSEYSVHVLAAVLKSFLRELTEPLLTTELYSEFVKIADIPSET